MSLSSLKDIIFKYSTSKSEIKYFWSTVYQTDPFFEDVYLVVDLVFANGFRHRMATDDITIYDKNGKSISYSASLAEELNITRAIELLSGQAQQRTLSFRLSAREIKPLEIMKQTGLIAGFGEISLVKLGSSYELRYPLIVGDMVGGITFGVDEELMELQVSDPELTMNKLIPEHFISPERNPYASDANGEWNGERYPIVLHSYPAVPCLRLSAHTLGPPFLVCSGWDHKVESVYIGSLEAYFKENDLIFGANGYEVKEVLDGLGGKYIEIDFNYTSGMTPWEDGESVYAVVERKTSEQLKSGTVNRPTQPNTIIDLMEVLLQQYSVLGNDFIDQSLLTNARRKLKNYFAKICINGSSSDNTADITSYIEQTICGSFPMINMVYTGFGYAPTVIDRRDKLIKIDLVRGQNLLFDRITSLTESSREEVFNSFVLKYDYDPISDNYLGIEIADETNDLLCSISKVVAGSRTHEVIESPLIYDSITAKEVIAWLTNHLTLPHYYVEYEGSPSLYFMLLLGDNITLTDDKLGFTKVVCSVKKLEYTKGKCTIGLILWFSYQGYIE